VPLGHHDFKPFSKLLEEVWERYRKPILIAETGCEGTARPAWIHYVCQEVRSALTAGIPILGICIYPITDYNGWDNGRACETGLFTAPNERGVRQVCQPFLEEIHRQQAIFDRLETGDQRQAANDKPGIALNGIIRHPLQKLRRFAMTIAQRQA
jgi:hypothetical protein